MDMNVNTIANNINTTYNTASATKNDPADKTKEKAAAESTETAKAQTGAAATEAATYEKSADTEKVTSKTTKRTDADRSAIVAQLQEDLEKQKQQLLDIVRKSISGQGNATAIATDDESLWHKLANGDFTVDAATKAQAQEDISEDGYWGVNQTSDRILDFAKALSGDDPTKADELLDAFKKGFEEATKTWGKELPDISKQTYDAVLQKFDDWKNSANAAVETATE